MRKSRIKTWQVFNEASTMASFGGGPFTGANPTALSSGSPVQPNDPQLTTDAYDRIKNSINANQITLQRMTQSIFKNNNLNGKVGKYTNELDLKELKILQMFRNQAGSLDVSIEFKFEGFEETYPTIQNLKLVM